MRKSNLNNPKPILKKVILAFLVLVSFTLFAQTDYLKSKEVYFNEALIAYEGNKFSEATQKLIMSDKLGGVKSSQLLWTEIEQKLPLEFRPIDRIGESSIDALINSVPANTWALLTLVLTLFFSGLLIYWFLKARKLMWLASGIGCFVLALAFLFAAWRQNQIRETPIFVVNENIDLRISPSEDAKSISIIPSGTQVFAEDNINGFILVRLSNDESGWILKDKLLSTVL